MSVDDLGVDSVLNDDFVGPRSPWWVQLGQLIANPIGFLTRQARGYV